MDRVAHPAKVLVESCHASNQAVVDETPEAQQFSEDCLGFALSVSVFGPVSLRCKRDAQPYVYEQTRKRKARRNHSLTLYLSSSVRRSRLAATPHSPAAPRPLPAQRGPLPNASCLPQRARIHQRKPYQVGVTETRQRRANPVYQARRTHHGSHEKGPAKGAIALPVLRASDRLLHRALPDQRVNIRGQALRYLPFVMTNKDANDRATQDRPNAGEVHAYEVITVPCHPRYAGAAEHRLPQRIAIRTPISIGPFSPPQVSSNHPRQRQKRHHAQPRQWAVAIEQDPEMQHRINHTETPHISASPLRKRMR
jgi:hypothetical protein